MPYSLWVIVYVVSGSSNSSDSLIWLSLQARSTLSRPPDFNTSWRWERTIIPFSVLSHEFAVFFRIVIQMLNRINFLAYLSLPNYESKVREVGWMRIKNPVIKYDRWPTSWESPSTLNDVKPICDSWWDNSSIASSGDCASGLAGSPPVLAPKPPLPSPVQSVQSGTGGRLVLYNFCSNALMVIKLKRMRVFFLIWSGCSTVDNTRSF